MRPSRPRSAPGFGRSPRGPGPSALPPSTAARTAARPSRCMNGRCQPDRTSPEQTSSVPPKCEGRGRTPRPFSLPRPPPTAARQRRRQGATATMQTLELFPPGRALPCVQVTSTSSSHPASWSWPRCRRPCPLRTRSLRAPERGALGVWVGGLRRRPTRSVQAFPGTSPQAPTAPDPSRAADRGRPGRGVLTRRR